MTFSSSPLSSLMIIEKLLLEKKKIITIIIKFVTARTLLIRFNGIFRSSDLQVSDGTYLSSKSYSYNYCDSNFVYLFFFFFFPILSLTRYNNKCRIHIFYIVCDSNHHRVRLRIIVCLSRCERDYSGRTL